MGMLYYSENIGNTENSHVFNVSTIDYSNQNELHNLNTSIHVLSQFSIWFVLLVTILLGAVGNILVLYVYINRKDNKTCTFFIKILAVVDLTICVVLAPLELYQITIGIRNEILCKFYGFLSTHVLYSTLLILIIAFDRYFCICWPLYKIITIHRARLIVIICGIFSSLLAIIPSTEYSTVDHILQIHKNHSKELSIEDDENESKTDYKHVEHIQSSAANLPYSIGNATHVKCSPQFLLTMKMAKYIHPYRTFHATLFAICICLVLILYAFIYNAVYQRRVTRTRKLSAYRRIIRTYLMNNEPERADRSSPKDELFHRRQRRHRHAPSTLTLICCYCCQNSDDYRNDLQRPTDSMLHEPLNESQRRNYHRHLHDEPTSIMMNPTQTRPRVVLEVNGGGGKRYSAVSMTSMTYLTSGVWDDTTSTSLIRSRINSIAATTYCGTEHSSTSRPSTSTEDSFDQTSKHFNISNTLSPLRPMTPSSSTHLTVPGQQATPPATVHNDHSIREDQCDEPKLPRSISQCAALHPSIVRKTSNTLSIRQIQRPSDASFHQRKVSFLTSAGVAEESISEDPVSVNQQLNASVRLEPTNQTSSQVHVQMHNQRSLSTVSSIDNRSCSIRNFSISSARRPSAFDGETQRILDRQQTQERLANIRTTLTLFVVTATFLLMYLPSVIHTLFRIKPHAFRDLIFLLCYINSACNPLIYSFFNVNFRNDIRRIYECQKREYLARQC